MKKGLLIIAMLIWSHSLWAQSDQAPPEEGWDATTTTMFNLGQMSYNSKWASGGSDVFSVSGDIDLDVNYTKVVDSLPLGWEVDLNTPRMVFANNVELIYGAQKKEGFGIHKSSDALKISSLAAYRIAKDVLFTGDALYLGELISLSTQFSPGYLVNFTDANGATAYYGVAPYDVNPVTGQPINPREGLKVSSFMAPGSLHVRAGYRYLLTAQGKDLIMIQFAPVSLKQTYVLDDEIRLSETQIADAQFAANFDIHGTLGKMVLTSFGSTVDLDINVPLGLVVPALQDLSLTSNIVFFTPYQNPSLDVVGKLAVQGKINKYISANFMTNFIYGNLADTDLTKPGKQKALQIKGNLGIGVVLQF